MYPGRVGAFRGTLDFATEAKVGDFADERCVDENVSCGKVAVHVVHLGEVLHAAGDATQHAHQLEHLELAVVGTQKRVQAAVFHELGDYHHGIAFGHHALKKYHVGVLELTHY